MKYRITMVMGILGTIISMANDCGGEIKKRAIWLSRQRDGSYMASILKPVKARILGTDYEDFYLQPGEPIGLRHWCPGGVKAILGIELPIGGQARAWISGGPWATTECDL